MVQTFARVAGIAQLAIGLLSQFIPGIGSLLGAQAAGGNVFNMLSGAALGYLGFKGSESSQRAGAQVVGGLNGLAGVLGALGVTNIAGIQLNQGVVSIIINLLIAVWGLYGGFAKRPAAATAR